MAYHKVILRGFKAPVDHEGVVRMVASIQQVSLEASADMVGNLPLTVAARCTLPQALTMKQIFSELGALVDIDPPGVEFRGSPGDGVSPVRPRRSRSWLALALVLVITGLALVAMVFGGAWILQKVHPERTEVERKSEELADSLRLDPRNADLLIRKARIWLGMARQKMNQGDWKAYAHGREVPYDGKDLLPIPEADTAFQALQQAKRIAPRNAAVYFGLGELYLQKGLLPEAVEHAQKAVDLDASNPAFHNLLGAALLEMENYGKAELCFRKAYSLAPEYLPTYRNLGSLLLYHQRDTAQGLEWLFQYLARENGEDRERYILRKEMVAAAFAHFNPPWEQMFPPPASFASYELDRLRMQRSGNQEGLAKLYLSRGLTDAALPLLVQLSKSEPSPEVRKMLVCTYAKLGLWDAAEANLRQTEFLDLRDPFFAKNLSLVYKYYRLNHGKAKELWDRYENLPH